jgi:hypothetical protein
MTFNEKGVQKFAVPFEFVKLDGFVRSVHVVLLQGTPEGGEAAADEVAPSNGLLVSDELVIGLRVLFEFF